MMDADALRFEIQEETLAGPRIKVIGVGGGGTNAVSRLISAGLSGVEFYALNTDAQALAASRVANKVVIGRKLTRGFGAGSDVGLGREAAVEDTERIIELLQGAEMVFITAGLGGGTGTGAAPVVASLAKSMNALTVAVVTKPFSFEGPRRMKLAEKGLAELAASVDSVIAIPNDRILEIVPRGASIEEAFRVADDVLVQAVQGISGIMMTPGLINRDFSDIRAIMLGMGHAMMGTAEAAGESAAVEAARRAIHSPLLDGLGVKGARAILIHITGSDQLGIHDVNEACSLIRAAAANDDVQISFGLAIDPSMGDRVKVSVIAAGFEQYTETPSFFFSAERESAPRIAESAAELAPAMEPIPEPAEPVRSVAEPVSTAPEALVEEDLEMPAFLLRERKLFQ